MSDIKIHCNKCDAKFFVLNREKIICTKCNNTIVVKNVLQKPVPSVKENKDFFLEEPVEDELGEELFDFSQDKE